MSANTSSEEVFMRSLKKRAMKIPDSAFKKPKNTVYFGPLPTCVAVAQKNGVVAIRNSNDPEKVTSLFSKREWKTFVKAVKAGEFDAV